MTTTPTPNQTFIMAKPDAVERGRSGWMRIPEETGGVPLTLTLENPWERFRIGPGTPCGGPALSVQRIRRRTARRWPKSSPR